RAARGGRVLVDLLRAAVHDPDVADVVRVDRQAGRRRVGRVDGPAAQQGAGQIVLVDFVAAGAVVHDPERRAVGDDALGVGVFLVQFEVAGGALAARTQTGGASVLVNFGVHVVQQPDVGAVGGEAFYLGVAVQTAGAPGTEQYAVVVVDIDGLVVVHDPDGLAVGPRGHAPRAGVPP